MVIRFTKMHGLGNDYIYVDAREYPISDPVAFARRWSDRRTGIGSDGLILIGSSQVADFSMRIFNADGSEALMCGNGARCIGKYVFEKGLTDKTDITLETLSGVRTLKLFPDAEGKVPIVRVGMGKGEKLSEGTFAATGRTFEGTVVHVGNPHLVIFIEDADAAPVDEAGPVLERHPAFPDRTNVEFVSIIDKGMVRMRVWERGSGITSACGTGACAAVVAATSAGLVGPEDCRVIMDGGELRVSWDPVTQEVMMTGPAETSFEGTIEASL